MHKKKVLLNRAMFSIRPYESSALTVLTTLFHHFTEAGNYELFVRRGGAVIHRAAIQVGEKGAQQQLNLDLAALRDTEARECCDKEAGTKYALAVNSIMGFYVSQGTGAYSVEIARTEHKERRALDSAAHVPPGDLFAVTLVRPGTYRAVNEEGGAEALIRVKPPDRKDYRAGEAVLVTCGAGAFKPKRVEITSGHSVVFRCETPARLRVELVDAAESAPRPRQEMRHTLRRSPGPPSHKAT
ncbi:MAG: hypothetical protein AB1435_13850 [Chloroflexota bacterium]